MRGSAAMYLTLSIWKDVIPGLEVKENLRKQFSIKGTAEKKSIVRYLHLT